MRSLRNEAWVIECSWLKKKPRWHTHFVIVKGRGYYALYETKKKAQIDMKIAKECGQIVRLIKWKKVTA
jgi:hypothetical protein